MEFAICRRRTAFENAIPEATIAHAHWVAISKDAVVEVAVGEGGISYHGVINSYIVQDGTGYVSVADLLMISSGAQIDSDSNNEEKSRIFQNLRARRCTSLIVKRLR